QREAGHAFLRSGIAGLRKRRTILAARNGCQTRTTRGEIPMRPWILLACLGFAPPALATDAADYPIRPIRMILPQSPGSTTDALGRIVFTRVADRLGRQIVVDNRPGAGGTMGMEIAARATPDGYTLTAIAASMLAITPHIYRKLAYDPQRDFIPVGLYVLAQTALCVNAALPVKTV